MRLHTARVAVLLLATSVVACATEAEATDDSAAAATDTNMDWDRVVERPKTEVQAAGMRSACKFKRGDMPAETLGASLPVDADIPIKTIVVIMQENRSFDSYFSHLNQYIKRKGLPPRTIESAPEDTSNPERVNEAGSPRHPWKRGDMLCVSDTNHEWDGSHVEWNGGKMDGFFQANHGFREEGQPFVAESAVHGGRALWWYDDKELPYYYDLAATFAIADHYHASLLGPTYPNRDYLYAATSKGVTDNSYPKDIGRASDNTLIFDELENRGMDWAIYMDSVPHVPRVAAFTGASFITRWQGSTHLLTATNFKNDAKYGILPPVVFVDAHILETVEGNDEHPPGNIQKGQQFVRDRIQNLFDSPQWKEMAIFVTYDEGGGIYDHVAPPKACPPDDIEPILNSAGDRAYPGRFDRLGFRVPFIAVSPFSKPGYVSHKTYDHTSITRFIETKFKLPALSRRDANADPLLDLFDFSKPHFLKPPALAEAVVDPVRHNECVKMF